jgi:SH3-like domain-containing protein
MTDNTLDRYRRACHGSRMWLRVVHGTIRILFAFAIVLVVSQTGAVTQAQPATLAQPAATPVVHPGKAVKHRVNQHPGATKADAAKNPGGDQKVHGTLPVAVIPPVPKPPKTPPPVKESTEPPPKIPRFAALKTDDTNMRRGPGQRYPIDWVYQRRDLPVEVEREYDVWRYVRDPEGVEGWVHQVTLSDRRTFMITGKDATLRADAKDTASAVAVLKVGVIGRLKECAEGSQWCQVQAGGYRGYLRRDQFWGLLPDEAVAPS